MWSEALEVALSLIACESFPSSRWRNESELGIASEVSRVLELFLAGVKNVGFFYEKVQLGT